MPIALIGLLCLVGVIGCEDEPLEETGELCREVYAVVDDEPYDCAKLADELDGLIGDREELIDRIRTMPPPDGDTRANWLAALAPCHRARLELSLGICADDNAVHEAVAPLGGLASADGTGSE